MILDEIVKATRQRVVQAKKLVAFDEIQKRAQAETDAHPSFYQALAQPGMSFICEVKRASPSKGMIAEEFPYKTIASEYQEACANAISVLSEPTFFLGKDAYVKEIADLVELPVLRKDFIIDPYQIYEAKLLHASAILLICAILTQAQLNAYLALADALGMDALVEAHDEREIAMALDAKAKIIGVNNRDLKTFQVDLTTSKRLRHLVPKEVLFVSESGIHTASDVKQLQQFGVDAVLIGESLMMAEDKQAKLNELRGIK